MKNRLRWRTASAIAALWLSLAGLSFGAAAAPGTAAEPEEEGSEEIVVTGTMVPRTAGLVPASVSVLSGEAIEAAHAPSLNEMLRSVAGLHLQQNGSRGGNAALYLRGLDPNHVLLLVDGVRLNDPTNIHGGSFDPTTLALLEIDRIEVVRGPLSSVYGSDALAGAINVITRRTTPDDPLSFSLDGGGGRFATGHVRGRASSGFGWAGLSLAGSYESNGDPSSDGGYSGGNLKATLDATLPGEIDVRADLRFSDATAEAFPEFSGGPDLAVIRGLEERDTLQLSTGLQADHQIASWLELAFRLEYFLGLEDLQSPGVAPTAPGSKNGVPPTVSSSEFNRTKLTFLGSASPLCGLRLTTGADVQWEDGESHTVYDLGTPTPAPFALDRRIVGWFVEGVYSSDLGFSLSASVRGDFPDETSGEWSPNVGGTLAVPGTPLTVYGSWGEGFKLPSFFALGNRLVGNPALEPERSRGWEVGVRGSFFDGRLRARIAYFDIEVRDLIDMDFDPETFELVNRDRAQSRGFEIEVDVPITSTLRFAGSTTFNPTNLVGSPLDLRNRPRWQGGLHLSAKPLETLDLGIRVLFIGSVKAASNPTGFEAVSLDAWERVDLSAAWSPREWLKIYLAVENLLDADYEEAVGFPALGIYPRAGLQITF